MATIQQIKDAINSANTLGRTNLAEKGITVDNTATTYQIMQKISETSDVFVITASGNLVNCTIDKTYAEIFSAAQAGRTIILLFPKPFSTDYWVLSPPSGLNSDNSGTFRCIIPSDVEEDAEYILFVTIYPDNTVQAREERFIKELDHRVNFKVDEQNYQIITVKNGQSVSAPSPNPTSESGTFAGWLNGETITTFPLTPIEDLELNAKFSAVRTEMEWNESGFWLRNDGYDYQKLNNAKTLGGTAFTRYSGTYRYYIVMVGETMEAVQTNPSITVSNLEYDGRIYYYVSQYTTDKSATNSYNFTPDNTPSYASAEAVAKATLDRYFYKTD